MAYGNGHETEMVPRMAGDVAALESVHGLQQIRTSYTTAMAVQRPRQLAKVEERLMLEADQAGEDFYYGWGAGKDRVEGPSVGLAMSAVRCFGNCAVEMLPVQETRDAWIFTAAFVDLETGFTLTRQFRQSKKWTVYGKFDESRKEDIRFQIGQSKATRNVVVNAVPRWLVNKCIDRAKGGVREKVQKTIDQYGMDKVIETAVAKLDRHGIDEPRILLKFGRNTLKAITVEDLVMIRGDLSALDQGLDTAENMYPMPEPERGEESQDTPGDDAFVRPEDLEQPRQAKSPAGKRPPRRPPSESQDTGDETSADSGQPQPQTEPAALVSENAKYFANAISQVASKPPKQALAKLLELKQELLALRSSMSGGEAEEIARLLDDAIRVVK